MENNKLTPFEAYQLVCKAERAWRKAADKGYGDRSHYVDMDRVDARIRKLQSKHIAAVEAYRALSQEVR